jgi:hypothetical protein
MTRSWRSSAPGSNVAHLERRHDPFQDDLSTVGHAYAEPICVAHRPSVQRQPDGRHDGVRLRQKSDLEPIVDVRDPFEPTDGAFRLFSLDGGRHDPFQCDHASADCRPNLLVRKQRVPLERVTHGLGDLGVGQVGGRLYWSSFATSLTQATWCAASAAAFRVARLSTVPPRVTTPSST